MKKAIAFLAVLPSAALAHPGHEAATAQGPAHWLTSADHLVVAVALGVALWCAIDPRPLQALRRAFRGQ